MLQVEIAKLLIEFRDWFARLPQNANLDIKLVEHHLPIIDEFKLYKQLPREYLLKSYLR